VEVRIPDEIEKIDDSCFYRCRSIRCVTFGSNSKLGSIEGKAFWECGSLNAIDIPSPVTFLGYGCFSGCRGLLSVSFCPVSMLNCISDIAFFYCSLEQIIIPSPVKNNWITRLCRLSSTRECVLGS
jgi:hypothetical protein